MWKHSSTGRFVFHRRAYSSTPLLQTETSTPVSTNVNTTQTQTDSGLFVDADNLPANGDVPSGVAQNGRVVTSGIVQAYVLDIDPIANLSGTYTKTINGIPAGKVVLIYNRDTKGFIMSSTKSNELELLRDRLDALTTL